MFYSGFEVEFLSEYEEEKKMIIEAMMKLYKMKGSYRDIYDHVIGKMDKDTLRKVIKLLIDDYLVFEDIDGYRLGETAAKSVGLEKQFAEAKESKRYKPKEVDYDDYEYTVVDPTTGAETTAVGRKYHDKRDRPGIFGKEFCWIWGLVGAFVVIGIIIAVLITVL